MEPVKIEKLESTFYQYEPTEATILSPYIEPIVEDGTLKTKIDELKQLVQTLIAKLK